MDEEDIEEGEKAVGFAGVSRAVALDDELWVGIVVLVRNFMWHRLLPPRGAREKYTSSQVNTLPKAKSKTRSKQNKDMHTCSSVYSERGVPLPVLTSGGE